MLDKSGLLIVAITCYMVGLGAFFTGRSAVFAILLLCAVIALMLKNIINPKFAIVVYLAFVVGFVNGYVKIKNVDDLAMLAPRSKIALEGTISSNLTTNEPAKTKFYFDVEKVILNDKNVKLSAKTLVSISDEKTRYKRLEIGDRVKIYGKLNLPLSATNPSQFDYAKYLRNRNVFTMFYGRDDCFEKISPPVTLKWKFLHKLNLLKDRIMDEHKKYIRSPEIELVGGIILGDDAVNPPDELKASFIHSGLVHITAASGINVALIFGGWFWVMRRLRMSERWAIATGMLIVLLYACMTGFPPSLTRASLMLEFVLLGKLIDRTANTYALLFFVAFLMLAHNPGLLNDIGFKFSFVVTLGLILMCSTLCNFANKKLPPVISDTICIPFIAQLWIIPIQMYYFNIFVTYSLLANIIMMPFYAVASWVGFASFALAMIPWAGDKIVYVSSWILKYSAGAIIWISDFFARLPHSVIVTFKPSILQIVLYYVTLTLIFLVLKDKFKNKKLLISALISIILSLAALIPIHNKDFETIVFDVGDANLVLLKSPKSKYFLIDTGSPPFNADNSQARQIAGKYLKDRGIRTIEAVILTNDDPKHAGGLGHILEDFKVKKVIKSSAPVPPNPLYTEGNFKIDLYPAISVVADYKDNKILFSSNGAKNVKEKVQIAEFSGENQINDKLINDLAFSDAILSVGTGKNRKDLFELQRHNINVYNTDAFGAIRIRVESGEWRVEMKPSPEFLSSFLAKKFNPLPKGEGKAPLSALHSPLSALKTLQTSKSKSHFRIYQPV